MEAPPKKKMTTIMATFMLGVALVFSTIILIFSTLPISAPVFAGAIISATVTQKIGHDIIGRVIGDATGWLAGISLVATEYITGVGIAAISAVGEVVADSFELLALGLIFPLWYLILGIKQFGGKHAVNRLFISMASLIAGLIPLINILPTVLIGVSLVILSVRKEDAENLLAYEKKVRKQKKFATTKQQNAAMLASQRQRAIHDSSMALG